MEISMENDLPLISLVQSVRHNLPFSRSSMTDANIERPVSSYLSNSAYFTREVPFFVILLGAVHMDSLRVRLSSVPRLLVGLIIRRYPIIRYS
jgi:hypothetical protein